jgi:hypothetical protein
VARGREALQEDHAATAHQRAQRQVHQAAHVVDRQVAQQARPLRRRRVQPQVLHGGGQQQALVREHRGLGPAGGARGEDDGRGAGQRSVGRIGLALAGQHRQGLQCGQQAAQVVEDTHRRQRCQSPCLHKQRFEVLAFECAQREQQARLHALDGLRHFGRRVARVQAHVDGADAAGGHQQQQVFGPWCGQQRQPVTGTHTGCGQRLRGSVDLRIELVVRPMPTFEADTRRMALATAQDMVDAAHRQPGIEGGVRGLHLFN